MHYFAKYSFVDMIAKIWHHFGCAGLLLNLEAFRPVQGIRQVFLVKVIWKFNLKWSNQWCRACWEIEGPLYRRRGGGGVTGWMKCKSQGHQLIRHGKGSHHFFFHNPFPTSPFISPLPIVIWFKGFLSPFRVFLGFFLNTNPCRY